MIVKIKILAKSYWHIGRGRGGRELPCIFDARRENATSVTRTVHFSYSVKNIAKGLLELEGCNPCKKLKCNK